jgi:hypothetical protein
VVDKAYMILVQCWTWTSRMLAYRPLSVAHLVERGSALALRIGYIPHRRGTSRTSVNQQTTATTDTDTETDPESQTNNRLGSIEGRHQGIDTITSTPRSRSCSSVPCAEYSHKPRCPGEIDCIGRDCGGEQEVSVL